MDEESESVLNSAAGEEFFGRPMVWGGDTLGSAPPQPELRNREERKETQAPTERPPPTGSAGGGNAAQPNVRVAARELCRQLTLSILNFFSADFSAKNRTYVCKACCGCCGSLKAAGRWLCATTVFLGVVAVCILIAALATGFVWGAKGVDHDKNECLEVLERHSDINVWKQGSWTCMRPNASALIWTFHNASVDWAASMALPNNSPWLMESVNAHHCKREPGDPPIVGLKDVPAFSRVLLRHTYQMRPEGDLLSYPYSGLAIIADLYESMDVFCKPPHERPPLRHPAIIANDKLACVDFLGRQPNLNVWKKGNWTCMRSLPGALIWTFHNASVDWNASVALPNNPVITMARIEASHCKASPGESPVAVLTNVPALPSVLVRHTNQKRPEGDLLEHPHSAYAIIADLYPTMDVFCKPMSERPPLRHLTVLSKKAPPPNEYYRIESKK